jgi:amino acid adenylation domain-containing protein
VGLRRQTNCIQRIFEDQVAKSPNSPGVCGVSESWSYVQLNAFANRAANRLKRAGVKTGSLVGVSLPRSLKAIAILIGILKAGAAYVPFDVAYPEERLRFMVEDAGISCLISDRNGLRKFSALLKQKHPFIDVEELENESPAYTSGPAESSDLAYVMYTSGSTGVPKGVMVEHKSIARLVCEPDYMSISSDDVFIQLAPLSFDASTLEIWAPLLNGAKLVVPPPEMNSLADIADVIRRFEVTTLWLTSGLFNAIVDEYPESLCNLKQLLSGGDVLSPVHVRKAMEAMKSGCVINGYGPTENTTFTCCHSIRIEDTNRATIPIGRPIRGTEVYILDENMRAVTGQQVGEVFIGGQGLARGYLNRPDLTKEKFVPNPFSANPNSRLYKSGDLAHYNAQRDIEFDGRVDLQVKIRGFRIELSGVEAVINSIPGIASSAAVVKHARTDSKRLVCYFVRRAAGPDASALERAVADKLPAYMMPSEFVELDQLPLNPNGKVDRRYLSECEATQKGNAGAEASGTAGKLEREVAGMFGALLNSTGVGADDDFFHLGGNSLVAARLFARIEKQFGRRLPLATVLNARTPRTLAAVISDHQFQGSWDSLVPLKTTGSQPPLFLVHAIGGNVVGYQELASCLPADQPLYALQARGLDGKCPPAKSVEEMAACYIAAIRSVQPQGPYHLGGYSAGGVVALAIACRLQESGAEVGNLILIDSSIEGPVRNLSPSTPLAAECSRFARTVRGNLAYMRRIGIHDFLELKRRNWRMNARIVAHNLRVSRGYKLNVEESFIRALRSYKPGRFHGGAVLLRTADAEFSSPDITLGWSAVVDAPVHVSDVPGDHDSILMKPQVEILAARISAQISRTGDPLRA